MATMKFKASVRLPAHPRLPNPHVTATPLAWCEVVKGT
jgi:hypothetical protein